MHRALAQLGSRFHAKNFQNQERDGVEELSPQMPSLFLSFLQGVTKVTDDLSSLSSSAILHKTCPECSKKAGKGLFRSVVPDLPGQPPASFVTSLKVRLQAN